MILMNWVRNHDGSFTAFRVRTDRAKLARFIQGQLIAHMQAIYCHEQAALALYRALAEKVVQSVRREAFLQLAEQEAYQLARRAEVLMRLNASVPGCVSCWGRLRHRVLIWLGPRATLAWIKSVKQGDVRRQVELMNQLEALSK